MKRHLRLVPSLRRPRQFRGQALVETALILPILMLILMGIIQFGLMLSAYVGATNVAREVARYGSVCLVRDGASATSCGTYTRSYLDTITPDRVNAGTLIPSATSICYDSYVAPKAVSTDPDRWNVRLTVNLAVDYPLFVPIIGNLIDGLDGAPGDGAFRLRAEEAMRVEGGALPTDPGAMPCS